MRYFGTDGIRDAVDGALLQPDFVRRVGAALGAWLRERQPEGEVIAILGRDTRASGPQLAQWLQEGAAAHRVSWRDTGVVPTPAVALAVREAAAPLGVMLTASHNPASDNGIKLFGPGGLKWTEAMETALEAGIDAAAAPASPGAADVTPFPEARARYLELVQREAPAGSLEGWKLVVDTANGATHGVTPEVLRAAGATVTVLGDAPDGQNINAGVGSEHPEGLAAAVKQSGARLGLAHDGDGDRLVVVDDQGALLDGDQLLGLLALSLHERRQLAQNTLVVTVTSNAGLAASLESSGIDVERVAVGDRHVLHRLLADGLSFGGESSGHMIFTDLLPAGDGLLAALQLLQALQSSQEPLSRLRAAIRLFPQGKRNLRVREKIPLETLPGLDAEVREIEDRLAPHGRLLLRYSGTEPKIRLLVESPEENVVHQALKALEAIVSKHLDVVS